MPRGSIVIQGQAQPWVVNPADIRIQTDPEALIDRHWQMLGHSPGQPVSRLESVPGGSRKRYQHGAIYIKGGDYRSVFWVYGAIGERYEALGGPGSALGFPTSEEAPFTEGGRMQSFERGDIYWWPDVGAIELDQVVLHYAGLICFAETDWDQASTSDEPYVTIGVVAPHIQTTNQTRVYEGVDAGQSRPDVIELYKGKPNGLVLSVLLMEHDEDNPDKYKEAMAAAVGAASSGITTALAAIPVAGPFLAMAAGPLLAAVAPDITNELNSALDLVDDHLGAHNITLTPKQMVVLAARTPLSVSHGVEFKLESPSFTAEGAEYKVYFGLERV